jgi:hypothetical protein
MVVIHFGCSMGGEGAVTESLEAGALATALAALAAACCDAGRNIFV